MNTRAFLAGIYVDWRNNCADSNQHIGLASNPSQILFYSFPIGSTAHHTSIRTNSINATVNVDLIELGPVVFYVFVLVVQHSEIGAVHDLHTATIVGAFNKSI